MSAEFDAVWCSMSLALLVGLSPAFPPSGSSMQLPGSDQSDPDEPSPLGCNTLNNRIFSPKDNDRIWISQDTSNLISLTRVDYRDRTGLHSSQSIGGWEQIRNLMLEEECEREHGSASKSYVKVNISSIFSKVGEEAVHWSDATWWLIRDCSMVKPAGSVLPS